MSSRPERSTTSGNSLPFALPLIEEEEKREVLEVLKGERSVAEICKEQNIGTHPLFFRQIKQEIWDVSLFLPATDILALLLAKSRARSS